MRFGTWNIKSLYRASSLMTVSRELSKYRLDLMGVQEVRWEGNDTAPAGEYTFFLRKEGMRTMNWVQGFVQKRIISTVKRVEIVSDRMSYIILRGLWFHINFLNVHAPTEDKTDDVKGSFYEEFECIFNKLPKYHVKILLDFNAKVSREEISVF
jgi:exonuclease III